MTPGVKDGPASTIAIGPDDTLLDVFDRIRAAGQTPVELRIPNESSLFLTAAEFRTLRDVTDHGRHVVTIRTPDPLRLQLAKLFGLDVSRAAVVAPAKPAPPPIEKGGPDGQPATPATTSAPAPAETSDAAGTEGEREAQDEASASAPVDEPVSSISESEAVARWPEPVDLLPVPSAPRRLVDRVSAAVAPRRPVPAAEPETDSAVEPEPVTVADAETEQNSTPVAATDDPPWVRWAGGRALPSPAVLIGAAVVLAVALVVVVAFLLPSARVRLELASVPINSALLFDVTASGQPLDGQAAFALPGEQAEATVVYEASIPTTGVETIPDAAATGSIRLANPTSSPITVEAATILTTEAGVEFALTEAVEVPAADPVTSAPGQAEAAIEAVDPGTGGNVGTGEIGGRLPNGVYYSNRESGTTGGAEREVPVVAQADLDALLTMAEEALPGLVAEELALDDGRGIVVPSLTVRDGTDDFNQPAGAEAETVTLRAERTVSVLTYNEAEASERLAEALGEQLSASIPSGYELGPLAIGSDAVTAIEGSADGGRFRVDAEARASLAMTEATETELASQLAGKSPAEVGEILSAWPEVTSYEIEPGFRLFTSNLPMNAGRIEIDDGA